MAEKSTIEWTDATWNPVTGCTEVSPGCDRCYARVFAERLRGVPAHPYEQGFDLRLWPERLDLPLQWKKPRRIFVNSMSDLFHQVIATKNTCHGLMIRLDQGIVCTTSFHCVAGRKPMCNRHVHHDDNFGTVVLVSRQKGFYQTIGTTSRAKRVEVKEYSLIAQQIGNYWQYFGGVAQHWCFRLHTLTL